MCESQNDQGKRETRRSAKRYIKNPANQKSNSNTHLHAALAFARNATRHDRADGRSDSTCRKKNANATSGAFANGKDSFAENGQQREYAAAESPRRFHQQVRQDTRAILDVSDALDRLGYPQNATQREFPARPLGSFRNAYTGY